MEIKRNEVLRYLGYREQVIGDALAQTIDRAIADCRQIARPKYIYRLFALHAEPAGLRLGESQVLLTGTSIRQHLQGATRCALLAATLGIEVENRIRVQEHTDLTAALAMDAAATTLVEAVCDRACEEIAAVAQEQHGQCTGTRFSPGYGDLPLELQPDLLAVLDADLRIGLTCTDNLILLPRKSVTAVVGLFDRPADTPRNNCATCDQRDRCAFSRTSS